MKKILVVIDMQVDFVNGSLGSKEAEGIVSYLEKKVASFDGDIIFTKDTHPASYLETQEGKNLPVEHCIKGTAGWSLIPCLQKYEEKALIFEKPTFASIDLAEYIHDRFEEGYVDEVEIVGLCTDICVLSNALTIKAFSPELKLSVDSKACAGVTEEKHLCALESMRSCQINVY